MQRIVLHYDADEGLARRIRGLAGDAASVAIMRPGEEHDAAATLQQADILWHVLARADARLIAAAPGLRLIQKIGVGVNTIDLDAARARGIAVCNMPGTNTAAVAEMTLLLMLACLRRLPAAHAGVMAGRGLDEAASLAGKPSGGDVGEIAGRTVGFLGHGAVPRRLTPALAALGARVIYWNRSPRPDALASAETFDTVLATADILSLHLPAAPETRGIVGTEALGRMKKGAILINTARGELVDEAALATALAQGRLAAAGLDTFEAEPDGPSAALLAAPNTVFAPHIAWRTGETFERSIAVALDNGRRLAAGRDLLFRVA